MTNDMDFAARARRVRLIVFDVDGVLTDGGVYIGPEGEAMKRFDIKDGLGIALWHRVGGKTAILTGRSSEIVRRRAEELHITNVLQGCADKREAYVVSRFPLPWATPCPK